MKTKKINKLNHKLKLSQVLFTCMFILMVLSILGIMGMRKYDVKRKEMQAEHAKQMGGKKTILVPHPTQPRCWIEKSIEE